MGGLADPVPDGELEGEMPVGALALEPRRLDPATAFDQIAQWVAQITEEADGIVVPLSGTDSVLTFLACAEAFRLQGGRLQDEIIGIHYGANYPWANTLNAIDLVRDQATIEIVNLKTEDAPRPGDPTWLHPERHRWGAAQTLALEKGESGFWIAGTRNRTEEELGTFSIASKVAIFQPIIGLWKSEVLQLCSHLALPEGLLHASRCGDMQCGRPPVWAENIELVDKLIMIELGELDARALDRYDPSMVDTIRDYVRSTLEKYAFKRALPYTPPANMFETM